MTGRNGATGGRGALLLVDVFNDFAHADGTSLQASFRDRLSALERLLSWARHAGVPVVYANDALGEPRCCRDSVLNRAASGPLGDVMTALAPLPGETFVVKPLYSAFEQTGLDAALRHRGVDSLLVAGSATERCVTQTVMGAVERDFDCAVVADACPTVDPQLAELALEYLTLVAGAHVASVGEVTRARPRAARSGEAVAAITRTPSRV